MPEVDVETEKVELSLAFLEQVSRDSNGPFALRLFALAIVEGDEDGVSEWEPHEVWGALGMACAFRYGVLARAVTEAIGLGLLAFGSSPVRLLLAREVLS